MSNTPSQDGERLLITNIPQLLAEVKEAGHDLAYDRLAPSSRFNAWKLWNESDRTRQVLDTIAVFLRQELTRIRQPFCPLCGSTRLIELREATVYLPVCGVHMVGYPSGNTVVTGIEPVRETSIFDDPEIWRCDECDFETEDPATLQETARLGATEKGVRKAGGRVHVKVDENYNLTIHIFDCLEEKWKQLPGPDGNLVQLPVDPDATSDDFAEALDTVHTEIARNLPHALDGRLPDSYTPGKGLIYNETPEPAR